MDIQLLANILKTQSCDNDMNYFESTYRFYKEYQKANGKHPVDGYNIGYTIEGLEILEQMDYLYEKAMTANEYFAIENAKLTEQFTT
tara:strand:+ start:299 stop:559 length:261 start_codon:yes stop_codon:yes gene_type:complete